MASSVARIPLKVQGVVPRVLRLHSRMTSHKILPAVRTMASLPDDHFEYHRRLTEDTLAPGVRDMKYAVRGKVVAEADRIARELAQDPSSHKFEQVLYTNIGNPHAVGQKPLTWPRQVMALCDLPDDVGVDHPRAHEIFPADAIDRAREIKAGLGGKGTGAYTHSQGAMCFREDICQFLEKRDGVKADPNHIFMTNGASRAIDYMLAALIADERSGVMIPIPQYPIYSATIALRGGQQVGYNLDESNGWDIKVEDLERTLNEAIEKGIDVNSFVLINPGNPTGKVLSRETIKDICHFCSEHSLVLLADEVYQENIYDDDSEFYSCKRGAHELGLIDDDAIELVSFHSTSKGLFGECGRRGGYMELVGFDPKVESHIYKLASSGLCSTVDGQIMTSLMARGPEPGSPSYESHERELSDLFTSLKRRSEMVSDGLDKIEGFSCQKAEGAMYCYPSIKIPPRAQVAAQEQGITPDTLYALSLLESTGICVVPASGFGGVPGRFGFRTTFLPPEEEMKSFVSKIADHHQQFCARYALVTSAPVSRL